MSRHRTRSLVAALLVAVAVVAAGCAPAPGASPPTVAADPAAAAPVVLVPGWELGCTAKADDWDAWRDAFVARGLPEDHFVVVHYDSCRSNLATAAMVAAAVDDVLERSGAQRVHLIAHSMGAIISRWCVQFGGCAGKVDQLVTVAGANHGTVWAGACALQFWAESCVDLRPGSAILRAINADETPEGVGYETWVSVCELVIVPRHSAFLDGAVNHDVTDQCVEHSGWKWHEPTISAVSARLTALSKLAARTVTPTA